MDLPTKNDITNILGPQKPVIYSRYMQSGFVTDLLEMSEILTATITGFGEACVTKISARGFASQLCEWIYFRNSSRMIRLYDHLRYVVQRGNHV